MMLFFANPLFLYGLAAVSIPLVLHLLHKGRAKPVQFSTLRFLHSCISRHARRLKLRNLLLLFLRMGIIALLCLALAKPLLKISSLPLAGARDSSSVVIVLDNSYSMGFSEKGQSLLEGARQTASDIVNTLTESDEVTIILMNEDAEPLFNEFTHDIGLAGEQLLSVTVSNKGTDASEAMDKAIEYLERSTSANREMYVLSDFQEDGWKQAADNPSFSRLPGNAIAYVVPFGTGQQRENVFIENVSIPRQAQVSGVSSEFTVRVINTGTEPASEILTLAIDGQDRSRKPVMLQPGVTTCKLPYSFKTTGNHRGKLSLRGDRLEVDDTCYFEIFVQEKLPVLCVDGDPSDASSLSESFFVMAALNPALGASPILPEQVALPGLDQVNLSRYALVLLCNVPQLGGSSLLKMERYLNSGGNLVIFLGNKVNSSAYNQWSFMPAPLVAEQGYPDKSNFFNLDLVDYTHPVFRKFNLPGNGDLSVPRFYRFYSTRQVPESRVLARFSDGQPAFIESSYGSGKVILVTTSADSSWTNLPLRRLYPALLHQIVHYAAGRKPGESYLVGDTVSFRTEPGTETRIGITDPLGESSDLAPVPGESYGIINLTGTRTPGIYEVSGNGIPANKKLFAVNLDTRESILNSVAPENIKTMFGDATVNVVDKPEGISSLIRKSRHGVEFSSALLRLALIFFVAELFLANRFSRGRKTQTNET